MSERQMFWAMFLAFLLAAPAPIFIIVGFASAPPIGIVYLVGTSFMSAPGLALVFLAFAAGWSALYFWISRTFASMLIRLNATQRSIVTIVAALLILSTSNLPLYGSMSVHGGSGAKSWTSILRGYIETGRFRL